MVRYINKCNKITHFWLRFLFHWIQWTFLCFTHAWEGYRFLGTSMCILEIWSFKLVLVQLWTFVVRFSRENGNKLHNETVVFVLLAIRLLATLNWHNITYFVNKMANTRVKFYFSFKFNRGAIKCLHSTHPRLLCFIFTRR